MNPGHFLLYETSKGFPDENIKIGVKFEAGGTYETWGFVIYNKDKIIAEGKTIESACRAAANKLMEGERG